ncbi:MAG: hypothetical protein HY901_27430 [Deltaproteobacteria bacterium]|nr:hypothetical protein [Deltaproteobacteria bacterium]
MHRTAIVVYLALQACAAGRVGSPELAQAGGPSPGERKVWLAPALPVPSFPMEVRDPPVLGPGGSLLLISEGRVLLHDLASGRDVRGFHIEFPRVAAISADGSMVAIAAEREVGIFRRDSSEPMVKVALETAASQLVFSSDGASVVALLEGAPSALVVLDARTGAVRSSHRLAASDLPLRLYPGFVVVGDRSSPSPEPRLLLRDFSGKPMHTWSVPDIAFIAFDQAGRRAAMLGKDESLRIQEQVAASGGSGESVKTLWSRDGVRWEGGRRNPPMRFDAEGRRLVLVEDATRISFFDAASGALERTASCAHMSTPTLSPDGRWAIDGTWTPCDLQAAEPSAASPSRPGPIRGLREGLGRVLALAGDGYDNGATLVFDSRAGALVSTLVSWAEGDQTPPFKERLEEEPWLEGLAVSSDGRRSVAAWGDCLMIHERSAGTAELSWGAARCIRLPGDLREGALISADGRRALAEGRNGVLVLFDLERAAPERTFELPASEERVEDLDLAALGPDGRWALALVRYEGCQEELLVAWHGDAAAPRWSYRLPPRTGSVVVAVAPQRAEIAVALKSGEIRLFDQVGLSRPLVDLAPSLDHANHLLYLSDGSALVVGTERGGVFAFPR